MGVKKSFANKLNKRKTNKWVRERIEVKEEDGTVEQIHREKMAGIGGIPCAKTEIRVHQKRFFVHWPNFLE